MSAGYFRNVGEGHSMIDGSLPPPTTSAVHAQVCRSTLANLNDGYRVRAAHSSSACTLPNAV